MKKYKIYERLLELEKKVKILMHWKKKIIF